MMELGQIIHSGHQFAKVVGIARIKGEPTRYLLWFGGNVYAWKT